MTEEEVQNKIAEFINRYSKAKGLFHAWFHEEDDQLRRALALYHYCRRLEEALRFYADKKHMTFDPDVWEKFPLNGCSFVEDGAKAREALGVSDVKP